MQTVEGAPNCCNAWVRTEESSFLSLVTGMSCVLGLVLLSAAINTAQTDEWKRVNGERIE